MRISDWSSDVCSSDLDRIKANICLPWWHCSGRATYSVIVDLYIVIFSGSAFMFDSSDSIDSTVLPPAIHFKSFTDARAAVERLVEIYARNTARSEEHTSELQSLMRISYAVFCLKQKKYNNDNQ